jgi:hypothetical protein
MSERVPPRGALEDKAEGLIPTPPERRYLQDAQSTVLLHCNK